MTRLFPRIIFWMALIFTVVMAMLPHPPEVPGQPGDKVVHIVAFTVLAILALWAFPSLRRWQILVYLAALGALIEVVQAIPVLHRSSELMDWLADTIAVTVVIGASAGVSRARKALRGN